MSLAVAELSARRGAREVLTAVSFTAHPGHILGVIGPNGAGKTTLFECVAGLLPHSGNVRSEPLFYVPDAIRPWPDQTVRWTLDLQARMFRTTNDRQLIDELLPARVGTLSKGEAKRLGLALGLIVPRPVLLLDEPFDGLDLRQARQAMDILRRDAASGRTLVLSIHQLTDAARVCDRFLLLNNGRSVAEGTLAELGGNLEEAFLERTG
jgi:ABC-2 type transport system ATP-binding protein